LIPSEDNQHLCHHFRLAQPCCRTSTVTSRPFPFPLGRLTLLPQHPAPRYRGPSPRQTHHTTPHGIISEYQNRDTAIFRQVQSSPVPFADGFAALPNRRSASCANCLLADLPDRATIASVLSFKLSILRTTQNRHFPVSWSWCFVLLLAVRILLRNM
jgi:hypothetical protein